MTDDAVVEMMGKVFGEVELSVRVQPPPDVPERFLIQRARAVGLVKGCHQCGLRDNCTAPVAVTGPVPADYMVIGEAPGVEEDAVGKGFVGPSGRLLRAQLDLHGLSPSRGSFLNAVACYPNRNGKGVQPSTHELAACRGNLLRQMQVSWCQVILLCGANAISAWRHDMKVARVNGKVYVWDDQFIVVPCIHPAAILRGAPGSKKMLGDALTTLASIVNGDKTALSLMDDDCIRCDSFLTHIDGDGVGYCDEHWGQGRHDRAVTRQRWEDYAGVDTLL